MSKIVTFLALKMYFESGQTPNIRLLCEINLKYLDADKINLYQPLSIDHFKCCNEGKMELKAFHCNDVG